MTDTIHMNYEKRRQTVSSAGEVATTKQPSDRLSIMVGAATEPATDFFALHPSANDFAIDHALHPSLSDLLTQPCLASEIDPFGISVLSNWDGKASEQCNDAVPTSPIDSFSSASASTNGDSPFASPICDTMPLAPSSFDLASTEFDTDFLALFGPPAITSVRPASLGAASDPVPPMIPSCLKPPPSPAASTCDKDAFVEDIGRGMINRLIAPPSQSLSSSHAKRPSLEHSVHLPATRKLSTHVMPLDAPIQARTYVSPSATSRREIPASFKSRAEAAGIAPALVAEQTKAIIGQKRRASSDCESETMEPGVAQLMTSIDRKRAQNTLAARKSRMRKQEQLASLQETIDAQAQMIKDLQEQVRILQTADALSAVCYNV